MPKSLSSTRAASLLVKLSPEIKDELQTYTVRIGVTMSAYVAMLIGQNLKVVHQTEQVAADAIKNLIKDLKEINYEGSEVL